jgi:hypothetical protein
MTARYVASRTPELGRDAFGVRDRLTGAVWAAGLPQDVARKVARAWSRHAIPSRNVRVGALLFAAVMFVITVWLLLGIAADFLTEPTVVDRRP